MMLIWRPIFGFSLKMSSLRAENRILFDCSNFEHVNSNHKIIINQPNGCPGFLIFLKFHFRLNLSHPNVYLAHVWSVCAHIYLYLYILYTYNERLMWLNVIIFGIYIFGILVSIHFFFGTISFRSWSVLILLPRFNMPISWNLLNSIKKQLLKYSIFCPSIIPILIFIFDLHETKWFFFFVQSSIFIYCSDRNYVLLFRGDYDDFESTINWFSLLNCIINRPSPFKLLSNLSPSAQYCATNTHIAIFTISLSPIVLFFIFFGASYPLVNKLMEIDGNYSNKIFNWCWRKQCRETSLP